MEQDHIKIQKKTQTEGEREKARVRAQEPKGVCLCVRKTERQESRERKGERDKKKVHTCESLKIEEPFWLARSLSGREHVRDSICEMHDLANTRTGASGGKRKRGERESAHIVHARENQTVRATYVIEHAASNV